MRHDSPLTPGGLPRGGRVLLETQTLSVAKGTVELAFPASPYTRFQIEIDGIEWYGLAINDNLSDGGLRQVCNAIGNRHISHRRGGISQPQQGCGWCRAKVTPANLFDAALVHPQHQGGGNVLNSRAFDTHA